MATNKQHVLIVGAGVAGLQAARALDKQGIAFTILERNDDVGGVWRDNYQDYALQVPWPVYEFPEFRYPDSYKLKFLEYPDGRTVQAYIKDYTTHFKLWDHIHLRAKLLSAHRSADGASWSVTWQQAQPGGTAVEHKGTYDFLVIATGQFSNPSIPKSFKDVQAFKGLLLPGRDFTDAALLAKGKRVLVIGGGKTAADVAAAASAVAAETTLLFRRAHWTVPQWVFGFIPFHWLTYNRLGTSMLPHFYSRRNPFHAFLHKAFGWFKAFFWAFTSFAITVTLGLRGDLKPELGILEDQYVGGVLNRRKFYNIIRSGKIKAVKGNVDRFTQEGVVLTDGSTIGPFDVIVAATGYKSDYSYLDKATRAALDVEDDGLWLFRHVLPPAVANLAFVGSEHHTFQNIVSSGVQGEWLARVLAGHIALPSREEQELDVTATKEWKRSWMPYSTKRAAALQLHQVHYQDQLLKDAGFRAHTAGFNLLSEYFVPYKGRSYTRFFIEPLRVQDGKVKLHRGTAAITHPRGTVRTTPKTEKGPEYGGEAWETLLDKGLVKPVEVPRVVNLHAVNGKTVNHVLSA